MFQKFGSDINKTELSLCVTCSSTHDNIQQNRTYQNKLVTTNNRSRQIANLLDQIFKLIQVPDNKMSFCLIISVSYHTVSHFFYQY
jgi:hypothetical protein